MKPKHLSGQDQSRRFWSLRTKITLPFAVLVSVFLLGIGTALTIYSYKTTLQGAEDRLLRNARQAAGRLSSMLRIEIDALEELATRPDMRSMDSVKQRQSLSAIRSYYQAYEAIFALDNQGTVVSFPNLAHLEGEDFSQRDYFLVTIASGRPYISDALVSDLGNVTVTISVPIFAEGRDIAGVLVAQLDTDAQMVRETVYDLGLGKTGHSRLLDRKGYIIADPRRSRTAKLGKYDRWSEFHVELTGGTELVRANKEKAEIILSHVPVPPAGWLVVVEEGTEEIKAGAKTLAYVIMGSTAVAILLVLITGRVLASRLCAPLFKLRDGAIRLGQGRIDVAIEVDAETNDEIGQVARSFNQMSKYLSTSHGRLAALHRISSELSHTLSIEEIVSITLHRMSSDIGFDCGGMELVDESRGAVIPTAFYGTWIDEDAAHEIGEPGVGEVAETCEAVVMPDVDSHNISTHQKLKDSLAGDGVKSACLIPAEVRGKCHAVLILCHHDCRNIDSQDVTFLLTFGEIVGAALVNAALFKEANDTREKYQHLYEKAPVMYHSTDADGRILECNLAEANALGYSREELIGKKMAELELSVDRAVYVEMEPQADDDTRRGETALRKKDGSRLAVEYISLPIRDEESNLVGYRSAFVDITERREAERRIRYYADVVTKSNSPTFSFDLQGKVTMWNRAAEEISGYSVTELIGKPCNMIGGLEGHIEETVCNGSSTMESELLHKNGTKLPVLISTFLFRDEHGIPVEVPGVLLDISQFKNYQKRLKQLSHRVVRAQEEERSRISRELHDGLGQMLTAARMDVEWLRSHRRTDADHAADRLEELSVNIQEAINLVREISSELRPGILDDLGLESALSWYLSDFERRTQVSTGLFSEISEHTVPSEVATVAYRIVQEALTNTIRHASAKHVEIDVRVLNNSIVVAIADDGVGFDPARASDPHCLGLLGMQERAEIVGGKLRIESTLGQGALITATLPLGK